ncbi:MAG: interleukin-like EMT inducer domain-containing protein, partial [Anaerolineae bacterium]
LIFWLMTLGPSLRVNGQDTGIPLPFALVAQLPFFKGNRYPSRYSVLFVLSLSVLVAFGLAAILRTRKLGARVSPRSAPRTIAGLALVALVLFEHLSIPLPLSDMRVPDVYQAIADEMPGDWTLLDLPVAWRNGFRVTGTQHPLIMFEQYYQTVHGKRILAGNTSRNPPLKFQYFTEAPVLNTIIALETGHQVDPSVVDQDRLLAGDVLRFFNIEAILVHPEQTGPEMVPYIEAAMPVDCAEEGDGLVLCRVDLPPWPEQWVVRPGDALSRLSYAEGWGIPAGDVVWAQRKAVRLLVPLDGSKQQMAFRAYAPTEGQRLQIEINGLPASEVEMAHGWSSYEVTLPAQVVLEGLNEVWLRFETLTPADQVRLSERTIGQTGVRSPVNLVAHSAGKEVGDFGHIYVDGVDVSPGKRGYNLAVIHPETGAVEQTAAFDTHLDATASQQLAAFLGSVPEGRIVAVAASDEASRLLDEDAVAALRAIGAQGDLRDRFRWGQAIIGVQGAGSGTALEAVDWMRPVAVVVGEGATEPHLAAAFSEIHFSASPDE